MSAPGASDSTFKQDSSIPALPPDATPEQKDAHWYRHVYQGDNMPQFTVRAVVTGGLLGMLMSAANLYTTLSIGWAFGVAITASVMSYVIWTAINGIFGGRKMSILETNCMASTASAAGYSTGSTIATMFGALLLLQKDKLPEDIKTLAVQPWFIVGTFTFCTGLMGVFLAIPMKRQMINHEQLPFPSGIAAAETLRSLYSASREAVQKAYALIISLVCGAIIGVLNTGEGTLGFLDKFHSVFNGWLRLPEQFPKEGFRLVNDKPVVGYGFEPSGMLIAAGMIVGLRVSLSMLLGSALLYMWVGPAMVQMDVDNAKVEGYKASIDLIAGGTIYHFPRWALWGGTSLMVVASLAALAFQWKTIGRAIGQAMTKKAAIAAGSEEERMKAIEVPNSWMVIGMIPITIAMLAVQMVAFHISWWAGLIAISLSFVLSLVACRATGETDTTPIGAMGKVMQITFAILMPKTMGMSALQVTELQTANLASAGIAANSASSSADLMTDLKAGYLLGANPRKQFLAQFFGVFFGTLAIVPVWYLIVPTKAALEKFPAPATQTWYKVAQVLTEGIGSLPESAKYAIAIGGMLGIILPLIEKFLPAKARPYFPSAMGLGLSWIVPFANSLAFAIGAVIAWVWGKISARTCEKYNVSIASGLVAGESLIKAIIAMTATLIGIFSK